MAEKINIEGREISIKQVNDEDYISLTDIARKRENQSPDEVIRSWIRNNNTVLFLEPWEEVHNPNFKPGQMDGFKLASLDNGIRISVKRYLELTNATGIITKSGRYGGTFGHVDIAFEFASWVNPRFKMFLIQDYRKLKSEDYQRRKLQWDAGRELSRLNYPLQTSSIKLTTGSLKESQRGGAYASEADMLNVIVFNMTAKQWRAKNPDAKGNIRDSASTAQNVVLANLESFNAELIRKGASQESREKALGDMAVYQLEILNQKYLPE